MPNFESARIPKDYSVVRLTGIPALDGAVDRRSAAWGVYGLGRSSADAPPGSRFYRFKPKVDLEDLWKAYLADGYVQRTIDLIAGMVYHSGIKWSTPSPQLDRYLTTRFEIARGVNGYGWDQLMRHVVFEFVLYGNAFLVVSRTGQLRSIYGRELRGPVIASWYPVPARCMFPVVNREGTGLEGWMLRIKPISDRGMYIERYFPLDQVVHLAHNRPLDSAYGVPVLLGAIEDVRSLRQIEEEVLRMIHRFVNPRLHISTPDLTGTGAGVRPDMQQVVDAINQMSSDAVLVTMPGQEVRVLGAESFALRAEPYLEYFADRAISGLGMNEVTIGQKQQDPDMDTLDLSLRMKVRSLQMHLSDQLLANVLLPLLEEASWSRADLSVQFGEPDTRHVLRLYTIISNLYSQSVITLREARRLMQLSEEFDEKDMYVWNVQIPRIMEPLRFQLENGLTGRGMSLPSDVDRDRKTPGRPRKDTPADLRRRDLEGGMDGDYLS